MACMAELRKAAGHPSCSPKIASTPSLRSWMDVDVTGWGSVFTSADLVNGST